MMAKIGGIEVTWVVNCDEHKQLAMQLCVLSVAMFDCGTVSATNLGNEFELIDVDFGVFFPPVFCFVLHSWKLYSFIVFML